jgi:hypothetical protein
MYATRTLIRQPDNRVNFPIPAICNLLITSTLHIGGKATRLHYLNAWNEVELNQRNPIKEQY